MDYRAFLESKFRFSPAVGLEVDPALSNPAVKPMTAAIVGANCPELAVQERVA